MLRVLLISSLGLILVVVAVLVVRTMRLASRQVAPASIPLPDVDTTGVARRLAEALKLPTISHERPDQADTSPFIGLHDLLEATFPLVHTHLIREVVGELSLLYTWAGSSPGLEPIVLAAHLDVVPVPSTSLEAWTHPPFGGVIADGHVWGRGALDDKNALICILEAVESLLAAGYRPQRTVLLAFGHDEEQGGFAGARVIADLLKHRGLRAHLVLDEGLPVTEGVLPGVRGPVALVGMAEKGQVSVRLTVDQDGGHASMPPRESAIGLLARAVARLEQRSFPGHVGGLAHEMFRYLAPEMGFATRLAIANLWLFEPFVRRQLSARPSTAAVLRTTTAPTIIHGGDKANVLARTATAVINLRILPGEPVADVVARVQRIVKDFHARVQVLDGASEPTPVSPVSAPVFQRFQSIIRGVFPDAVVAPSLMIARSDARHYQSITPHIFRFSPVRMRSEDLSRMHGVDERISLPSLNEAVRFYAGVMKGFQEE